MHISLFSRCKSTLIGLFLISAFTYAQGADPDTLGTWAAKNLSPGNYDILGMAYGNNTYVIVGDTNTTCKGFIATSPDAKTWTMRSTGSTTAQYNSVIFSNGRFITVCKQPATGNARIWTSDTNGASWVARNSDKDIPGLVSGGLHSVASDGNGKLVAAGGVANYSDYGWITISTDNGTTWKTVRGSNGDAWYAGSKFYGVGYAKGKWYAFTSSKTYQSSDGGFLNTSWTTAITGFPGIDISALGPKVASNDSTVVIATTSGPRYSDDGGATWGTSCYMGKAFDALTLNSNDSSVVYAEGLYVLSTRSDGNIWVSENGLLWKRWKLPSYTNTNSLCFAKKTFWCTGDSGTISKSPSWFKARTGCSSDYPYTLFDSEDGPPNRIGLPQYRVNTASLNLVLESTLFYAKTPASPLNFKLVYNSKPTADGDTSIGPFGKNWRFRYESAVGRFGQEAQVINGGGRSHTFVTPNGEDLEFVNSDVTLKAPDGIFDTLVYKYNSTPALQRFELTLKASHLTYVYGTPGTGTDNTGLFYLKEIRDQFGRKTDFAVDPPTGKITSITNAGRTFDFFYSSFDGGVSERCRGIDMTDGRSVTFNYDSQNNLTEINDMMDYHGSYEYDENGFMTSMTTAGKTNTFTYLVRPGCEEDTIKDQYLATLTRPGGKKIKYELQDEGETVKRTDAAGQISLFKNKDGQTTAITDPLGNVRTISYNGAKLPETVTDEKGGVFTYEYDDKGNMTEKKDALDNITKYTYDSDNNTISVENALGKKWTYDYTTYQPTRITTPLGSVTDISYSADHNIKDITDARGTVTSFTFDPFGNVTSVSPSTIFTYDAKGLRCTSITDANSKVKSIDWDNNDRITTVTYTSAGGVSYTNTYNAFGQTNFTDELGQATSIVRDELGYVTSITDPLGFTNLTEYDADNRPIKTTDPLGRSTVTTYDKDGRPTVFTDSKGYKITRSYDGTGNLISFKDKNNAETTFEYDGNNRLKKSTDPLKKVTEITRDAIGRTETSKNARGQTITYAYDDDGRISGRTSSLAGATPISYVRDANGNITTQNDAWGKTEFTYDPLNRIIKIVYPDLKEVSLEWNDSGQLTSVTYPYTVLARKLVVSYTYDNFNRVPVPSLFKNNPGTELFGESRSTNAVTGIAVTIGPNTPVTYAMSYNSRGQITQIKRPLSNTQTDYSYDKGGRITSIQHSSTGGLANVAFTAKYVFDPVSNVTSETFSGSSYYQDTTLPEKMANAYNVAGQLTNRGGNVAVNDADGNITDIGAGNFKCTYDAENRLTKIERKTENGTETTDNTYNADGFRVKKVVGADTIFYHYLPSGLLLFTTDGAGDIIDRHIYAGSALVATCKPADNFIHYYGDRQAHVRFIASDNGTVLAKYDYLPYAQTGTLKTGVADTLIDENPFTFNGILGVQDEGNGMFLMQQRFYDSASTRFFQRDPLGFAAGSNLYAFGANNPMTYADPTGKFVDPLSLAAYAGAALLVIQVADTTARWYYNRQGDETKREVMQMRDQEKLRSAERNANPDAAWFQRNMNASEESKRNFTHVVDQAQKNVGVVRDVTEQVVTNAVQDAALGPAGSLAVDLAQEVSGGNRPEPQEQAPPPQPQSTEGGE